MLDAAIVMAPAKLNLVLRVGARREDGFHELVSLMARISLADRLTIVPAAATSVTAPGVDGGDTLVTSALQLLCEAAGCETGFRVRIDKRIPIGAGLGGGSSDAAAALKAANRMLAAPLPFDELDAVARAVGSDVPFFLHDGPALVRGRGEQVAPLMSPLPACEVVVAFPGTSLSTAHVYAAYRPSGNPLPAMIPAPGTLGELAAMVENDLGPVAEMLEPGCRLLREALLARGALAACVSGSGAAVFGLFSEALVADRAVEGLPEAPWSARATLA